MTIQRASQLLAAATAVCKHAEMPFLAWLTEQEKDRIERQEVRALFIGPTSSGKTSTLNALLGFGADAPEDTQVLPVGVAPLTAHLVDVHPGEPGFEAEVWYRDGRTDVMQSPADARKLLASLDPSVGRVVVKLPQRAQVPGCWVWTDSPGVGAFEGDHARMLAQQAIAAADLIALHVRIPRGIGPALPVLEFIRSLDLDPASLHERVVPILTDARSPARIPEIMAGLRNLLGPALPEPVIVPRRGEVGDLARLLANRAGTLEHTRAPREAAVRFLRTVIIPELEGTIERRENQHRYADNIAYLTGAVEESRQTIASLRELSSRTRREVLEKLRALIGRTEESTRNELHSLADQSSRLARDTWMDECTRTLEQRLNEEFPEAAGAMMTASLEELQREADKLLQAFEKKIAVTELQDGAPGFEEVAAAGKKLGAGVFAREGLRHLGRLGGRGGVALGVVNLGRMVVSRAYKLVGKKASKQLITSGIAKALKPLGKALKFLAKRNYLIDIAIETIGEAWGIGRAHARLKSHVDDVLKSWKDGPPLSLWGKLFGGERPLGAWQSAERMVDGAWEGMAPEDGENEEAIPGVDSQIEEAVRSVNDYALEWQAELDELVGTGARHEQAKAALQELSRLVASTAQEER